MQQMTFMNNVYNNYGITFRLAQEPEMFMDAAFTKYKYDYLDTIGSQTKQRTKDNVAVMKRTRLGKSDTLNVWIVDTAERLSGGSLNGVGLFIFYASHLVSA